MNHREFSACVGEHSFSEAKLRGLAHALRPLAPDTAWALENVAEFNNRLATEHHAMRRRLSYLQSFSAVVPRVTFGEIS